MPRVYQEACQVYIEQEIEAGLKDGKTPYSIGKEISAWVEKTFGRVVKADTVRKAAERERTGMDIVHTEPTKRCYNATEENQEIKTAEDLEQKKHGGKRKGSGRPTTGAVKARENNMVSDAESFALMAISQLNRIRKDDPKRGSALVMVRDWVNEQLDSK